jgi:erythromycin esterase
MDQLSDASVFPLATIDPAAPLDDLDFLPRSIGDDVRIVAVGESVHGAHEFYWLRHRLIRFLVERMGFTAVAWESGFPEGFLIDSYIQSGPQNRDRVLIDGMTMHMGRCQEMADLVDWLRARNQNLPLPRGEGRVARDSQRRGEGKSVATQGHPPIHFYGLDLPGSSATLRPVLDVVAQYVESVDPGFRVRLARIRELIAMYGPLTRPADNAKLMLEGTAAVYQYVAIPAADRNELTCLLADLSARFDAMRRSYVERSDAARYEVARQHLRVAAQLDLQLRAVAALMSGDTAACEANIRDLTMADTVEWILRQHQRIIILAHNGHIQRTPISTAPPYPPVDTLGVHLQMRFGHKYLPIGTTCGRGDLIVPRTITENGSQITELVIQTLPPADDNVIDSVLDANLQETALLDLRSLGPQSGSAIDRAKRMRIIDQFVDIDVRRAFDMLIHVPQISLWSSPTTALLTDTRNK